MRNSEVAKNFVCGRWAETAHVTSTGTRLYSYNTAICERDENGVYYFNASQYSNTTAKHQSDVLHALRGLDLIEGETLIYCYPDRRNIVGLAKYAFGKHKK